MESSGRTRVTLRQKGELFEVKQMEGDSGAAFPRHSASIESVLVVIEGQCTIAFPDATHVLREGDSFVVPAREWHQITADPSFRAVHIMPREIRFEFSR